MIITCPSCSAQYKLPDNSIGPKGRRVKCTSCAYTWLQAPAGENVADILQHEIQENFIPETKPFIKAGDSVGYVPVVKDTQKFQFIAVAIVVFVMILLGSLAFMVATRQAMTATWQPLALFYQTLGFDVPAPGFDLKIDEIKAEIQEDYLIVKGKFINPRDQQQSLPQLVISVSNDKSWLKDWPIDLNGKILRPKEEIKFEYKLMDIPEDIKTVTIRFSE
jgi:predicted Zn finger-like uncharacterized protein